MCCISWLRRSTLLLCVKERVYINIATRSIQLKTLTGQNGEAVKEIQCVARECTGLNLSKYSLVSLEGFCFKN